MMDFQFLSGLSEEIAKTIRLDRPSRSETSCGRSLET
jgi:hypothetical protein